jgi:hypothetical protein
MRRRSRFENLAEGLVTDYKLNGRRSLKTAALNNVKHLRAFFGFDRAIDISSDCLKTYQLRRREQGASIATVNRECATLCRMFSIAVDAGKLSRRPKFNMLDGERVRQGFVGAWRLLPSTPAFAHCSSTGNRVSLLRRLEKIART